MRSLTTIAVLSLAAGCGGSQASDDPAGALRCDEGWQDDAGVCVPVACGVGSWGGLEVDGETVFVDLSAAEGGDGSQGAPLRSIQAGLDLAGSRGGGLVAVAAGTYGETLAITTDHAGVRLAGRCRELVNLDASVGDEVTPGIDIDVMYGEAEVSGLAVVESSYVGVMVGSGVVRLVGLAVEGSAHYGVVAHRGALVSADLSLEDCLLSGNTGAGLLTQDGGTEVVVTDSRIRGTLPEASGSHGFGMVANTSATLRAERCVLLDNSMDGVVVWDADTQVALVDSLILGTLPDGNGEGGFGIQVSGGAELTAEGCVLEANTGVGAEARDAGTRLSLGDTIVRGTLPTADGEGGHGLQSLFGAALAVEGCEVDGNTRLGIVAGHHGTEVLLIDTTVSDTLLDENGEYGSGVEVSDGVEVLAERCVVEDNRSVGIVIADAGTDVALVDTTVRGTQPDMIGSAGNGIEVHRGATLTVEGCVVEGNTSAGVLAFDPGTEVEIRDSSIRLTAVPPFVEQGMVAPGVAAQRGAVIAASGALVQANDGPGLYAVAAGMLSCTGCSIVDNRFAGVVVVDGGSIAIARSTIHGTRESVNLGGGVGVFAALQFDWEPASLLVRDSTITDHSVAGAYLQGHGSYRLEGTVISDSSGVEHGAAIRCGDGVQAAGVTAWDGGSGFLLQDNIILQNAGAGLFLDDASAALDGNAWSNNAPDLLVQGVTCLEPREDYGEAPSSEICPEWDRPTCHLDFRLNLDTEDIDAGGPSVRPARSGGGL